jgi:MFS transporter, DHA2 family, multidrug resistance protein
LPPEKTGQASALINVARNLGGSIGVSMAQTLLARREQFHQSRFGENIASTSLSYQQTLQRMTDQFVSHGASMADAQRKAVGLVGQTLTNQAAYLSYIDVFAMLSIFAFLMVPIAFALKHVQLDKPKTA